MGCRSCRNHWKDWDFHCRRRLRLGYFVAAFAALQALSACVQTTPPIAPHAEQITLLPPASSSYSERSANGLSCVPYARERAGIALRGDAYTWWNSAAGIYQRGGKPMPGAVLVLSQTARLQSGHVAVVSQVVDARQILVDHANWIPDEITENMPVIDVSPANDWTALRFWNAPTRRFGAVYPAAGFIYANGSPEPRIDGNQTVTISSRGVSVDNQ